MSTKYPVLGYDEQIKLIEKFQTNNCQESMNRIICSNILYLITIAKQYSNSLKYEGRHTMNVADLVQEGVIGLMKAITRFDPTREMTLLTYAERPIRQAMTAALPGWSNSLPLGPAGRFFKKKVFQTRGELERVLGGEVSVEEILQALKDQVSNKNATRNTPSREGYLTFEMIAAVLSGHDIPIGTPPANDDEEYISPLDMVPSDTFPSPLSLLMMQEGEEVTIHLKDLIAALPLNQKMLLKVGTYVDLVLTNGMSSDSEIAEQMEISVGQLNDIKDLLHRAWKAKYPNLRKNSIAI